MEKWIISVQKFQCWLWSLCAGPPSIMSVLELCWKVLVQILSITCAEKCWYKFFPLQTCRGGYFWWKDFYLFFLYETGKPPKSNILPGNWPKVKSLWGDKENLIVFWLSFHRDRCPPLPVSHSNSRELACDQIPVLTALLLICANFNPFKIWDPLLPFLLAIGPFLFFVVFFFLV